MNIAVFECEEWEQDYLRERLSEHDLSFFDGPLDEHDPAEFSDAHALSVFIYSSVTREVIESLPELRLVATRSTGFDHVDLQACRDRGVTVSNVPYYGENTVAEHTFALILAISRNVVSSVRRVRGGSFDATGLRGFDLKGKTLGVIGTGHIGRHVIGMAKGFEMRVAAYDPFPDYELEAELGFEYMGLDDLLAQSDIITLHCPLNEHTRHLLNKENLQRVKEGAVLINTARGGLVDSQALLDALQNGRLSAAGLDVLEEECHIKEERQILSDEFRQSCDLHTMLVDHVLIHHPNVVVTPHNAFNSQEALERILDTTVESVRACAQGQPINTVGE